MIALELSGGNHAVQKAKHEVDCPWVLHSNWDVVFGSGAKFAQHKWAG